MAKTTQMPCLKLNGYSIKPENDVAMRLVRCGVEVGQPGEARGDARHVSTSVASHCKTQARVVEKCFRKHVASATSLPASLASQGHYAGRAKT